MQVFKKNVLTVVAASAVAVLGVAVSLGAPSQMALAKGGGGHGGTPPLVVPILRDFGPVGSVTPQGLYDYVKAHDPNLAQTVTQIQTNAPTDVHFLADINADTGTAVCNELSAYVYADQANANVRIIAQGHAGAIWSVRDGVNGTCN